MKNKRQLGFFILCIVLFLLPAQGFAELDPNKIIPNIYNKEQKLLDTDHFYEHKGQMNKQFLTEELKELTFEKQESQEIDELKKQLSFSISSESNSAILQTTQLGIFSSKKLANNNYFEEASNEQKQSFQIFIAFGVVIALVLLAIVLLKLLKMEKR